MTDDKTERVATLTADYSMILLDAYGSILEDAKKNKIEITTEDARGLAQTALNRAFDTVYPKNFGGKRSGGKGSGANYDNPNPIGEKFAWWIINGLRVSLFEKFKDSEKVNEYVEACWHEKFPNTPFEEDVHKWTTGQAVWIRNITEERHPDLKDDKGRPLWKKEGK